MNIISIYTGPVSFSSFLLYTSILLFFIGNKWNGSSYSIAFLITGLVCSLVVSCSLFALVESKINHKVFKNITMAFSVLITAPFIGALFGEDNNLRQQLPHIAKYKHIQATPNKGYEVSGYKTEGKEHLYKNILTVKEYGFFKQFKKEYIIGINQDNKIEPVKPTQTISVMFSEPEYVLTQVFN